MTTKNLALCAVLGAAALLVCVPRCTNEKQGKFGAFLVKPALAVSPIERSLRPNYPYSVIAGGAYSPQELRDRAAADPVVRAHYAGFALDKTRLVTLERDQLAYVSYRIRDRVLWTKQALRLRKGETLLTDGKHFSRTRCGNRLASVQVLGASIPDEPFTAIVAPLDSDAVSFLNLPTTLPLVPPLRWPDSAPVLTGGETPGPSIPLELPLPPAYTGLLLPPGWLLPTTTGFPLITTKVHTPVPVSSTATKTIGESGLGKPLAPQLTPTAEPTGSALLGLGLLVCASLSRAVCLKLSKPQA